MTLTIKQAEKAKPKGKKYNLSAGKSLFLVISPSGGKHWKYRYRINGKSAEYTLKDSFPDLSIKEALEQVDILRKLVKQGVHPIAQEMREKLLKKISAKNTFKNVSEKWLEIKAAEWKDGHLKDVTRSLKANVYPELGDRSISDILPAEILAVLREIEKRGTFELTSKTLQRIRAVFSFAIIESMITNNPAADLKQGLKKYKSRNHSYVSIEEFPELLKKIKIYDGHPTTKHALQFVSLVFLRTGELRALNWNDVNWERRTIEIPGDRMKMGNPHIVPLSNQAIDTLKAQQEFSSHSNYIFPQQNYPHKVMSENTLLKALERMGYRGRMTGHGFRHIASTQLNEMGFRSDLIEKQLAHGDKDHVRATYNKAQYLPERAEMMRSWADYIDGLRLGNNIATIRSANLG
jgi:integrase